MKKTLLTLFAAITVFAASAQIEQGTILVGASSNAGFSSTSIDGVDDNSTSFNIGLKGGYFVIDNLAVGLTFEYQKEKFGDSEFDATGFGLFGRYYVNGKIFAGAGFQSIKFGDADAETFIPLEVGYAAFITDNIAVEPSLNYVIGDGNSTFGLGVGFTLYLNRGN